MRNPKLLLIGCFTIFTSSTLAAADIVSNGLAFNIINYDLQTAGVTYPDEVQQEQTDYSAENIVIPASFEFEGKIWNVIEIGDYAFSQCNSLESITLPPGLTKIGRYAFFKDDKLRDIVGGENIKSIGGYAFGYCSELDKVPFSDIISEIGDYAFAYCNGLADFKSGVNLKMLGIGAFYGCSGLKNVDLSDFRYEIGADCFSHCTSLANLSLNTVLSEIPEGCFENCVSLKSFDFPASLRLIGKRAFYGCSGLCELSISDTLSEIGDYAFCNCVNISSWENLAHNLIIGEGVFDNLSEIKKIYIAGMEDLPRYSFANCSGLETIELGAELARIDEYAFNGSENIKEIYSISTIPPVISINAFENSVEQDATLFVRKGTKIMYEQDAQWCRFKNIVETDTFPFTGLEIVDNEKEFSISDKKIVVPSDSGTVLKVYDLNGKLLRIISKESNDADLTLSSGFYIVTDRAKPHKVIIP